MNLKKSLKFLGLGVALVFLALAAGNSVAQQSPRVITASGTGFIGGADGYIVTSEHVIREATSIKVPVAGTDYSATVVDKKPDQDLALLKISKSGLPVVAFGDSDKVQIGDQVVAIGCPEGRCGTITVGRVANLKQTATFPGGVTLRNLIMIDVVIAPGSSGGPLLNMKGEVVGITMGGIEGTRFGFAIPINDAIPLLQRVPSFSRSQMGQATKELSVSEIASRVGPSVVYVEAKREVPLANLLPREALGFRLSPPGPTPLLGYTGSVLFWRDRREVLEHRGFKVDAAEQVMYVSYISIWVEAFDLANEQQAQQGAKLLTDPIVTVHKHGPPDVSGNIAFQVCVLWVPFGSCTLYQTRYEHYELLLQRTENLSNIQVNMTVRVESFEVPGDGGGIFTGLLGAATFSLGDVTFFAVLEWRQKLDLGQISPGSLKCTINADRYVECKYILFLPNTVIVKSLQLDAFLSSFTSLINATLTAAMGR
jgi:S1-C subfamily serine protease